MPGTGQFTGNSGNSVGRATNNQPTSPGTAHTVGRATNYNAIPPTNPTQLDSGAAVDSKSVSTDRQFSQTQNDALASIVNKTQPNAPTTITTAPANSSFNARLDSLGLSFNPTANPLNELANYTYHIRFFLTNEISAFNNINPLNPNSDGMIKYVIAESGVTAGFNVTELIMQASTAPNSRKRNMFFATEFSMTIVEPLNLSLMDKIYAAAKELNIKNHLTCPYFLEVWFTGYNEDGTIVSPNLFYNIYRVAIRDVQVSTTQVGSTYSIKLIVYDGLGEMNQLATAQSSLKIKAITLSDFFLGLQDSLNNMAGNINNDGVRRNTYQFIYPDAWKSWNIKPQDLDKQVARQTDMSASLLGNQTVISITKGQGFETIVNYAVYLCQDAQKWITGETTGGATLSDHAIIRYVTVYVDIEIKQPYWDPVMQDYTKIITYTLVPTETVKAFTDIAAVNNAQKPATQQAKLQYLIQQNRLAKRYDYIYTGLNTEVLNLDIKIDNYWAINIPTWNQNNSYYQYSQGPLAAQDSQGYLQQKGLLPEDKPSPIAARIASIDQSLNGGTAFGNASYANGQPVNDYSNRNIRYTESLLEQRSSLVNQQAYNTVGPGAAFSGPSTSSAASSASGQTLTANLSSGSSAANRAAALAAERNFSYTPNVPTTRQTALASIFIEDLSNSNIFSPLPLPISGRQDPKPTNINAQQNADQSKVKPVRDPQAFADGTGFVGAIFGNLFDPTAFMNIEMTVRGDPWWIPLGNLQQTVLAKRLVGNQSVNNSVNSKNAQFLGGDNCVLVEYRVGAIIDDATGLAKFGSDGADFVNGIYVITEVTNTFSHGKFTQVLKGFKDILAQTNAPKVAPALPSYANPRQGDNVGRDPGMGSAGGAGTGLAPSYKGAITLGDQPLGTPGLTSTYSD